VPDFGLPPQCSRGLRFFRGFKQRWLVVVYGRLGTDYRSHLQVQSIASTEWRIMVCDITSLRVPKSLENRNTQVTNVLFQYFYLHQRSVWRARYRPQELVITIESEKKNQAFLPNRPSGCQINLPSVNFDFRIWTVTQVSSPHIRMRHSSKMYWSKQGNILERPQAVRKRRTVRFAVRGPTYLYRA
jgi:hypothetical protein